MWIEQRPILWAPINVKQKADRYVLESGRQKLEISALQYQYFDHLKQGASIHKMVLDFLAQGWLVSFREIYNLVESMVQLHWILNPEFQSYFTLAKATDLKVKEHSPKPTVANPELIKSLPFFRTLPQDLVNKLVKQTRIEKIPANTRICKTGDRRRELYSVIDGTLGVYRSFPDGKRQLISTVPAGSLFGEGGFLLNKPRGADVISLEDSTLAVIHHDSDLDKLIDSGKAESLQQRFWVLQGLMASDVFSHIPTETLDSLVFAGKIINAKEGTVLTKEGDPGDSFYVIIQGSVAFTQKGLSLRALTQGGIFGEVALMVSGGKRTATAQAQRDCILLRIEMKEFYSLLANHIILAKEIESIAWKRWETRIS